MEIPESAQQIMHIASKGWTKLSYHLGVTKIKLMKAGLLNADPSFKGRWRTTPAGQSASASDLAEAVANRSNQSPSRLMPNNPPLTPADETVELEPNWKTDLLQVLKGLKPEAFERLSSRLLTAAGFKRVQVTGKANDGGIDGMGMLEVSDLLSFHVFFQCKKYADSVGSAEVRNFRGALAGRTDKGLFITTGTFTPEARKEASRDGVPPIELIDGDRLCDLLQKYELGVRTRMVPEVTHDPDFFAQF